tara:strand:+ start:1444 stop:2286 length:843 start_codon:yes stop_codon:yes gene_type:complete
MNRLLLTGSTGLLAPYILLAGKHLDCVFSSSMSGGDIKADLCDFNQTRKLIEKSEPDWIIHTAALTDVDECQNNPKKAFAINSYAVENIVDVLPESTHLIYISTDQVYPDSVGPHVENNANPVNIYGKSKFDGERQALRHSKTTVLRTSFFGPSLSEKRKSIDDTMRHYFINKKDFTLFSDVYFSPLHMSTLTKYFFTIFEKKIFGVFNLGSANGLSKAEFGMAIAKNLNINIEHIKIGESNKIIGRAHRPTDLRLNSEKIKNAMNIKIPDLMDEIGLLI